MPLHSDGLARDFHPDSPVDDRKYYNSIKINPDPIAALCAALRIISRLACLRKTASGKKSPGLVGAE